MVLLLDFGKGSMLLEAAHQHNGTRPGEQPHSGGAAQD
jgi:hypothetical protein